MEASDVADFEKNNEFYTKTADGYYGGSDGTKMIGVGLGSEDLGYILEGVVKENKDFARNPMNVALVLVGLGELMTPAKALKNNLKSPPKPSPKFVEPTNAPQLPPTKVPDGYTVRVMKPTAQYPNGYWVMEKQ